MASEVAPHNAKRAESKRPLGVRVTPEQHRILAEAAKREHRSVNSFVVQAAMQAADAAAHARPRRTPEEIREILASVRAAISAALPPGRDILEEFLAERRLEAARE